MGVARTANPTLALSGLADGTARLSHQPGASKTITLHWVCVCVGGRSSCYNRIPSVCWDGGYALAGISCKQTPDEGRNGNREMQFDFFRVPEYRL